jgi:hypothetical protein
MDEPGDGMNLAIFNAEEAFLDDHQLEVVRNSYHAQKLSQGYMLDDQLVYPSIFWTWSLGCGVMESEKLQGHTTFIRKVLIFLILQPRDYFIHQSITLRKEFICAIFGRLVNLNIKVIAQAQRRYFAREDKILNQNPEGSPKEYGLRTFIPSSLTASDEYWRHAAVKCFAISSQLGSPTFSHFHNEPHWPDEKALMRGDGVFADSAIAAIIFKIKLSVLMNFIQNHQIPGKVSAFVWRIKYQKRGLPHAHILFWTGFDTQDIDAVDAVINARYPNNSPFLMTKAWCPIFAS